MAYLVYCPTCEHKISSNTTRCNRCGETEFFEREFYQTKEPCKPCLEGRVLRKAMKDPKYKDNSSVQLSLALGSNVPSDYCPTCNGRDFVMVKRHRDVDIRKTV